LSIHILKYYLAIDQGTHASRACLFDETGVLVCGHEKKIQLRRISDSHIEQDAIEIINSVKQVINNILRDTNHQHNIVACGIAIQRSSVLAWLKDGTAISPVLSWQDTRGRQQLADLKNYQSEIQRLSGLPLSAHYGASKLRYLLDKANSQSVTPGTLRLSPLISYLLYHILENEPYIVDHSNAQRTQLFGLAEMNWSKRLTELFGVPMQLLPDCVPVVKDPAAAHGKLADTDIPVCAVSGDQNAAFFGAGLLTSETALVNFGTGAFILRLLPHYSSSEKQLSGIACSDHRSVQYLREATINGAASALTWLENKHNITDIWKQLPEWLDDIQNPPVFINTIGGLGSPWWRSDIEEKFIIPGESPSNPSEKPESQAVAIIESIVFMVCANLEIMQSEQRLLRLRVSGGLSLLDGLCQRLADLSGLTVERMNLSEATARGIAWLAAGKPDGWSKTDYNLFEPANSPALTERYALFSTALKRML
jgi:glycerol kinase